MKMFGTRDVVGHIAFMDGTMASYSTTPHDINQPIGILDIQRESLTKSIRNRHHLVSSRASTPCYCDKWSFLACSRSWRTGGPSTSEMKLRIQTTQ